MCRSDQMRSAFLRHSEERSDVGIRFPFENYGLPRA